MENTPGRIRYGYCVQPQVRGKWHDIMRKMMVKIRENGQVLVDQTSPCCWWKILKSKWCTLIHWETHLSWLEKNSNKLRQRDTWPILVNGNANKSIRGWSRLDPRLFTPRDVEPVIFRTSRKVLMLVYAWFAVCGEAGWSWKCLWCIVAVLALSVCAWR